MIPDSRPTITLERTLGMRLRVTVPLATHTFWPDITRLEVIAWLVGAGVTLLDASEVTMYIPDERFTTHTFTVPTVDD